jgi:transposase InsO family protein
MGHIGQNALEMLSKATDGCEITPGSLIKCKDCETCIKAKATTIVSRKRPDRASEYLEKVHSDICGPISPETWTKKRYFTSFIDDKTRYADIALLRSKDQVYDEYVAWQTREQRQSGLKVKILHSDNAREYKSKDFQDLHRL